MINRKAYKKNKCTCLALGSNKMFAPSTSLPGKPHYLIAIRN